MHDPAYNDRELFRMIAEGDETAFRQLFQSYAPQLQPVIMHLTKTAAVADDIIQETFLRLWISRDKLPGIENPRSWILRIVFHQSFSWLRRQAVHHKALDAISLREETASTTEEEVIYHAIVKSIAEAVQQLPAQAKRIYLLSREKGLKIPEIALELGLSPNTVKNSLVRSLRSIRERIEQAGHYLPLFLLALHVMQELF